MFREIGTAGNSRGEGSLFFDEFGVDAEVDLIADHDAAFIELGIPGDAEIHAFEGSRGREADAAMARPAQ